MNKISVIVPNFNSENTITRCLDSILAQSYTNFELILVDDGSTDGTLSILNKYKKLDERVKVIAKTNGGVGSARNVGLRVASGEYVQFIDSDDDIERDMFKKMITTARETDADMVTCRFTHVCWKQYLPAGEYFMDNRKDCLRLFSDFFTFNVPWNKLYRRNALMSPFDESLKIFEDGLFVLENFVNVKKVVVLDDVLYNYYTAPLGSDSAVNAFLKTKFWETKEGYWFKQNKMLHLFSAALKKLKFERTESFIRIRRFDMAFIELVKLIASGVSRDVCTNEMYAIFREEDFLDSLKLFNEKPLTFTFEETAEFIDGCFKSYNGICGGKKGEAFFEYIDHFLKIKEENASAILDVITNRLMLNNLLHKSHKLAESPFLPKKVFLSCT